MEPYVVSFRKYRPQRFDSVVGQMHITSTLMNAIKSNQLAQAFLFCGPRGVGKTTCARIFAKTINCTDISAEGEACDQCDSCQSFNRGTSLAIHELDAASNNSVDDIRNLVDQVRYAPQGSKYKIYIIDEVHMLSTAAFNAFLKTLEEPPSYAIFILATTERHKILPTILSRCQIFDFNRIQIADISKQLASICEKEGIEYELAALHTIAQKADGALRDALSILDQIVSFSGGKLTFQAVIDNLNIIDHEYYFRCTDFLRNQELAEVSLLFDEVIQKGFDGINFMVGLATHFRNLLMAKDPRTVRLLEQSEDVKARYLEQSGLTEAGFLLTALNLASYCEVNYKQSKHPRLLVELTLMKMCFLNQVVAPAELAKGEKKKLKMQEVVVELAAAPPAAAVIIKPAAKTTALEKQEIAATVQAPTAPAGTSRAPLKVSSSISKTKSNLSLQASLAEAAAAERKGTLKEEEETIAVVGFEPAWKNLLKEIKDQKKEFLFSILDGLNPVPDHNFHFELPVHNEAQLKVFEEIKQELLEKLRKASGIPGLNFSYNHIELPDEAVRPVSSIEKMGKMVEKNPNVLEFVKRFDLEIQY